MSSFGGSQPPRRIVIRGGAGSAGNANAGSAAGTSGSGPSGSLSADNTTPGGGGITATVLGTAARLLDVGIQPLDMSTIENPVMVIHAPRGSGCTTLLGVLLASLPGLHGAVVLTDRGATPAGYMHGILPPQVIMNRPPREVLQGMIKVQQYALEHFPDDPLPRLCLALDDILYATKTMRDDDFKRDLKNAHAFNIAVLIATADSTLLPPDIHTFATHVLATRCVSVAEPKQLLAKMFVMFPDVATLQNTLDLCQPFEFLVGTLRVPPGASRALHHVVHSLITPAEGLPVLAMARPLVKSLTFALEQKAANKK